MPNCCTVVHSCKNIDLRIKNSKNMFLSDIKNIKKHFRALDIVKID